MRIGKSDRRFAKVDEKYRVSDDGLVWSGELPLEPIGGEGVNLHGKRVKIAYLVARAFVANSECRKWVRHRNGDRTDNRACNLEWSDEKEEKRRGRPGEVVWCRAWTVEGEAVGTWRTVREASEAVGVDAAKIRACLCGRTRKAGGLIWSR